MTAIQISLTDPKLTNSRIARNNYLHINTFISATHIQMRRFNYKRAPKIFDKKSGKVQSFPIKNHQKRTHNILEFEKKIWQSAKFFVAKI